MQSQPTHSTRRFFLHYAEMVVAMFIGMFALSKPADWLFGALGASTSSDHPAMMLFSMGVTMTVPMVAWMRFRGHAWRCAWGEGLATVELDAAEGDSSQRVGVRVLEPMQVSPAERWTAPARPSGVSARTSETVAFRARRAC